MSFTGPILASGADGKEGKDPSGAGYAGGMLASKPRLLYVVTLAEVGGAQSYVRDLLPAVRDRYDVTVAAYGAGPLRDSAQAIGVAFVPLRFVRRPVSPILDLLGLIELIRLFLRVRPEIVHLNSSKVGILGRLAAAFTNVPVRLFTAHGWAFKASTGRTSGLYLWADRVVRPLTTMIICVSENERRKGLAARVCSAARTVVIPNAVELGPPPEHRDVGTTPVSIVSVGRLAQPKDFSTLVRALALLVPGAVRLRVLGDGPLRSELEAEIGALGLSAVIELAGEVDDVRLELAASEIFVLSSRSEGMPLSVLEAMAAGLPVVASAVEGLEEVVVDGETGFLANPGDEADLADKLGRLVGNPGLRRQFGQAGRRRVERLFALPGWREAHLQLYESLRARK